MFRPLRPTQNPSVQWFTSSDQMDQKNVNKGFLTDSQIVGENTKLKVIRNLEEWTPDNGNFHETNLYESEGWSPEDMFKTNEENFGIRSTYKSTLKYTTENPHIKMREFEEWQGDSEDFGDTNVRLEANKGWDPEDMFKTNEQNYGVRSTYKPNMEGYTMQLSTDKNSIAYRKMELFANAKTREIQNSYWNRNSTGSENGDEEATYSAVNRAPYFRGKKTRLKMLSV